MWDDFDGLDTLSCDCGGHSFIITKEGQTLRFLCTSCQLLAAKVGVDGNLREMLSESLRMKKEGVEIEEKDVVGMRRVKKKFKRDENDFIESNWYKMTSNEIADTLKRDVSTVNQQAKQLGLSSRSEIEEERNIRIDNIIKDYMNDNGFSDINCRVLKDYVSEKMGENVGLKVVERRSHVMGRKMRVRIPMSDEENQFIIKEFGKMTIPEEKRASKIAMMLKRNPSTIRAAVKRLGLLDS